MITLSILNQKGGVAKTTTAVTLAHGLAKLGNRVLLVDLDAQGNVADAKGKPLQVAFNGYTRKDGSTSPMTGYIYPDTPRIVRSRMMDNPTGTTFHRCGLGKRTVKNGRAVKIN